MTELYTSWTRYLRDKLPGLTDEEIELLNGIADSMVIAGTAATKGRAVEALLAVIREQGLAETTS